MMKDMNFEDVCKLVEDGDSRILESANRILDVVLILSTSAVASGGVLPPDAIELLASVIEVKNEVTSRISPLILNLLNYVTGRNAESTLDKEQKMAAAYVLICYVAFFETLEEILPELMQTVQLRSSEKFRLIDKYALHTEDSSDTASDGNLKDNFNSNLQFTLPYPTDTFTTLEQRLLPVYEKLSDGFLSFLQQLVLWEESDKDQRNTVHSALKELPSLAVRKYRSTYFALAERYNEFFVWACIHAQEETISYIGKLGVQTDQISEDMVALIGFIRENRETIDLGFLDLKALITSLPKEIANMPTNEALEILHRKYLREVDEVRIIEDEYESQDNTRLTYPIRSEIFVPQSYQVLRYTGTSRLESKTTWQYNIRKDLGTFIVSYLRSPHSLYTPLIILGQPGSGKSMLTRFIAARLNFNSFTPIRIELRKINAELSIRDQVESQIQKTTGMQITWGDLRRVFNGHPMIIIFDGYDELLQASGKTFAHYLRDISKFQQEVYLDQGQPVQAIVTSRITLIDQASIPVNSTVIRLEPCQVPNF